MRRYRITEKAFLRTAFDRRLLEGYRVGVKYVGDLGNHIARAQRLRIGLKNTHQGASKSPVILAVIQIQGLHRRFIGSRGGDNYGVTILGNLLALRPPHQGTMV